MSKYDLNRKLSGINPLAYMGVNPDTPPQLYQESVAPTPHDCQGYTQGDLWLVVPLGQLYMLASKVSNVASWVNLSAGVSITPYEVVVGSITGATSSLGSLGNAGQVLTSAGAGAYPIWATTTFSGLTEFALTVGDHVGNIASLSAVGLNGETIMGNNGANPSWTSSPSFGGSVTALTDISTTSGDLIAQSGDVRVINSALSTASSILFFEKSRGAAALTSGDILGQVRFVGFDGTQTIPAAKIVSTSSGTIAATRVAGNLEFYTHPDSPIVLPSEPLLRLTINSAGNITVANPDAGTALTITNGGLTVSAGTTTLTALASTAATGVLTVSDTGVLAEVETGAAGTILVGTAGSPKFLAAGGAGDILASQGAGSDPHWIANSGGGMVWAQQAADFNMVSMNGYITNDPADPSHRVKGTLPLAASIGSLFSMSNVGPAGWEILQNAGQYIYLGNTTTTIGTTGSLQSTALGDTVTLVCIEADLGFQVVSCIGNIDFVVTP